MNINNSLNEVKTDLMSEANLNINLRRLVYDYYSPDPDKKRRLAKQRRLNKITGFKEAKAKFMNKQKHSRDTFLVKDALSYIKEFGKTKKKFDKKIFQYNKTQVLNGIKEIKKVLNSKRKQSVKYNSVQKILEKIRNCHIFFPGRLTEKQYIKAWKQAYVESNKPKSFDGKKFSNAQRTMMSGVSYF